MRNVDSEKAAALKQVPAAEYNPMKYLTNIHGASK